MDMPITLAGEDTSVAVQKKTRRPVVTSTRPQTSTFPSGRESTEDVDEVTPDSEETEEELETEELEDSADEAMAEEVDIPRPWLDDPRCPHDAIVVGPGEPIRVTGVITGQMVRVDKQVVRAFQRPRTSGWYFTLIYSRGTQVPFTRVQSVNGNEVLHVPARVPVHRIDNISYPAATTSDGFSLPSSLIA